MDSSRQGYPGKSPNCAVKMLTGLKETEYETRLKELGLETLEGDRHQAKAHDAQDTACK